LASTISKNVENLEQYNTYKTFLDSLASSQEKEEQEKAAAEKQATVDHNNAGKRNTRKN
jgi:hypothetical protein